jgi:hypothetical protein
MEGGGVLEIKTESGAGGPTFEDVDAIVGFDIVVVDPGYDFHVVAAEVVVDAHVEIVMAIASASGKRHIGFASRSC